MNAQNNRDARTALMRTTLSASLLSLLFVASAAADINQAIENGLKFGQADAKYGQVKFDLKIRYENVDSANPARVANAVTARLRLGYLTPDFHGLQGFAEYSGTRDLGVNDYNSTRNNRTQYDVVADPRANVLNQLWLSFKGLPDTEIKVGRQRVELDNQRFVSAADWRQTQQTFDGLFITNTSLPNTTFKGGYFLKRQTTAATTEGMQMPFVNLSYNFKDIGVLTSYAYFMDFNEIYANSNQTFGARFDGSRKINEDVKGLYLAEYAYQQNYGHNPNTYNADYYHLMAGLTAFGVTAKAGVERLDGTGHGAGGVGRAFNTPLALLHNFNGWADQFTLTPDQGLRDVYGSLGTEIEGVKMTGLYHEYSNDNGKLDFGNEWNFLVTKEFAKHYTLLAKYAYYDVGKNPVVNSATSASTATLGKFDTQKFWFGATISY